MTHTHTRTHTPTGELTKSAADKKSHLPSEGGRCDRGGRVRAQAPGETQQKIERAREKRKEEKGKKKQRRKAREERQNRTLMIT